MNVGNPYSFSISWEVIDDWNMDETFLNGMLYFSISEKIYPESVINSTLKSELPKLKYSLINIKTDKELFALPKHIAFKRMYDVTYPEDGNVNTFSHLITPQSFIDNGYFIFAVKAEDKIRILSSHLKYIQDKYNYSFDNMDIAEVVIDEAQLVKIIQAIPIDI